MGYRVGSVVYCRPDGMVQRTWPLGRCSAFHRGSCFIRWPDRVDGADAGQLARPVREF
jgi:hypothetical protein